MFCCCAGTEGTAQIFCHFDGMVHCVHVKDDMATTQSIYDTLVRAKELTPKQMKRLTTTHAGGLGLFFRGESKRIMLSDRKCLHDYHIVPITKFPADGKSMEGATLFLREVSWKKTRSSTEPNSMNVHILTTTGDRH